MAISSLHHKLTYWKELALQSESRPAHLAEIVRREPTNIRFCDTSGLGAGGVWLYQDIIGHYMV